MKSTEIVIQYEGKKSDSGKLDLFDAAESLHGFTRVLNRIAHAFANNDDARSKVPKPVNVATYMTGAKKGCFETSIEVDFSDRVVKQMGASVIVNNFWDYLNYTVSIGIGVDYDPVTPFLKKKIGKNEDHFDEMAAALEGYLEEVHRPIKSKGAETITFVRPRVGPTVVMNQETLDYVGTTQTSDILENWDGNVTKYNILTGFGRAYIDELGKTIPFNLLNFSDESPSHKSAGSSIEEGSRKIREIKRNFTGYKVTNAAGIVKRLIILSIEVAKNE